MGSPEVLWDFISGKHSKDLMKSLEKGSHELLLDFDRMDDAIVTITVE